MTFASCKKSSHMSKSQFADIEFLIYDFRGVGDTVASAFSTPSTIILKSDHTWTIDVGGSKSHGTYSWRNIARQQGAIVFTISSWTDIPADPTLSEKLKSALQSVNYCGYFLDDPGYANFLANGFPDSNFPFFRTNKK